MVNFFSRENICKTFAIIFSLAGREKECVCKRDRETQKEKEREKIERE